MQPCEMIVQQCTVVVQCSSICVDDPIEQTLHQLHAQLILMLPPQEQDEQDLDEALKLKDFAHFALKSLAQIKIAIKISIVVL